MAPLYSYLKHEFFFFPYQFDLSRERLANGNGKVESSDNAHKINIIKFPNSFLKN